MEQGVGDGHQTCKGSLKGLCCQPTCPIAEQTFKDQFTVWVAGAKRGLPGLIPNGGLQFRKLKESPAHTQLGVGLAHVVQHGLRQPPH